MENYTAHMMNATEVNTWHVKNVKRIGAEKRERLKGLIKAELVDNKNINYRKHMPWLNE